MRKPKIITRALSEREKEMLANAFGVPRFDLFAAYQNGTPAEYIGIKKGIPEECIIWNIKKMMRALKKFEKKENQMFQIGDQYKETWLSEVEGITKDQIINLDGCGIRTFQELRDVICYDKEWLPIVLRSHRSARKLIKIFKKHVGADIYE